MVAQSSTRLYGVATISNLFPVPRGRLRLPVFDQALGVFQISHALRRRSGTKRTERDVAGRRSPEISYADDAPTLLFQPVACFS